MKQAKIVYKVFDQNENFISGLWGRDKMVLCLPEKIE